MRVQTKLRVLFAEEKYTKIFLEDLYSNEHRVSVHKRAVKDYLAVTRTQQGLLSEGHDIKPQRT
jgi:hypothetical protein